MLPNFLIIGAQKSASTFIHICLADHPEIFIPPGEIPYFENPDFEQISFDEFKNIFKNVTDEKAVGIKRPNYLAKGECPERIHHVIPKAKLIVVLRDPVARAISAYFHYIRDGFIPPRPLEEGMQDLLDGRYQKTFPRAQEIIDFGFYYQHMQRYFAFFDTEQVLILFHKKILQNKLEQIQRIYRFLDVNDSYVPEQQLDQRPQSAIYPLSRLKFIGFGNKHRYTYNAERTRLFLKTQTFSDRAICKGIYMMDRLFLSYLFPNHKPSLSDCLKKRLYSLYKEDMRNLEELLQPKYEYSQN